MQWDRYARLAGPAERRALDALRPRADASTGTGEPPGYLSPEVLEGRPADEADNVWSLCVVLYDLDHAFMLERLFRPHGVFLSASPFRDVYMIEWSESGPVAAAQPRTACPCGRRPPIMARSARR